MEPDEKTLWNKKYSEGSYPASEPEPLAVQTFTQFLATSRGGIALDVAGGAGRNALWLAQRGWRVKLIDISEAGIALAQGSLRKAGLQHLLETEVVDLNAMHDLGRDAYDLVLVIYYLQRELFPALAAALKPGGLLIYQTYTTGQLQLPQGPHNPRFLLQPGELRLAFPSLKVLHYLEGTSSERATAELVARKA